MAMVNSIDALVENAELYRQYPQAFFDMCGWYYWEKQEEIMCSVRDNEDTGVVSCFSSGKTWLAAHLAAWFLHVYAPSMVIVVAPKADQIYTQFWGEFRDIYRQKHTCSIPLQGKPLDGKPYMEITSKHLITGIVAKNEAKSGIMDKMTGYHAKNVFIILDQADGLEHDIWRAIWKLRSGVFVRTLVLSNPLNSNSEFGRIRDPDRKTSFGTKNIIRGKIKAKDGRGWNMIKITGFDTPNVKAKSNDVLPGTFTYRQLLDYQEMGEDHPEYQIAVLANDVAESQMVVFTKRMVDQVFNKTDHPKQLDDLPKPDFKDIRVGFDPADEGPDKSAWAVMAGQRLLFIRTVAGYSTTALERETLRLDFIIKKLTGHPVKKWIIDAGNTGKALSNFLRNEEFNVEPIVFGRVRKVMNEDERARFSNLKALIHWHFRDLAELNRVCLLPYYEDEMTSSEDLKNLEEELRAILFDMDDNRRISIMKKRIFKKRIGRSPDVMEAVLLANYKYGGLNTYDLTEYLKEIEKENQNKEEKLKIIDPKKMTWGEVNEFFDRTCEGVYEDNFGICWED